MYNKKSLWIITLATIISILISYWYLDLNIAQWCYHHFPKDSFLFKISSYTTNLGSWAPHAIILTVLLVINYIPFKIKNIPQKLQDPKQKILYWKIALIYLITLTITTSTKILISRYRPYAFFEQGLFGFNPKWCLELYSLSLPSAHAAIIAISTFVLSQAVSKHKSFWSFILIFIAFWVGLTRIILSLHYLSDIIAGYYIGFFVSLWLSKKLQITAICKQS